MIARELCTGDPAGIAAAVDGGTDRKTAAALRCALDQLEVSPTRG